MKFDDVNLTTGEIDSKVLTKTQYAENRFEELLWERRRLELLPDKIVKELILWLNEHLVPFAKVGVKTYEELDNSIINLIKHIHICPIDDFVDIVYDDEVSVQEFINEYNRVDDMLEFTQTLFTNVAMLKIFQNSYVFYLGDINEFTTLEWSHIYEV